MKPGEEIMRPILAELRKWKTDAQPTVVALEGYPGSGKTTLASYLEKEPGVRVLRQDDYMLPLTERLRRVEKSDNLEQTVIREFHDDSKLESDMAKMRAPGQVLVVEGVFLLDPGRYPAWDKSLYVKRDWESSDARRMRREKQRWGKNYVPESDPRSLLAMVVKTYRVWAERERPEEKVDIVIDNQP